MKTNKNQTIKRLAVWRREYTRLCPLFARLRVYLSVQNRILINIYYLRIKDEHY